MNYIFDGKAFAREKEIELTEEVKKLRIKGIIPKLVSINVGDDPASVLYVGLKKKAAERIGCSLSIISYQSSVSVSEITNKIRDFNKDPLIHGIMIQLPLPENLRHKTKDIINVIDPGKDVDGMREESLYLTPTTAAVINVIKTATNYALNFNALASKRVRPYDARDRVSKVVVVGAKGFEGKKIFKVLKEMGYEVEGVDKETKNLKLKTKEKDILISVTGVPGLINKEMVKEGSILIDVGSPSGDIDKDAYEQAAFVSPVPGGIGPVTIACLMENLVEASGFDN